MDRKAMVNLFTMGALLSSYETSDRPRNVRADTDSLNSNRAAGAKQFRKTKKARRTAKASKKANRK